MLRIAGGVALGVATVVLVYLAAMKLHDVLAAEEADNPGAIVAVLIVIVGSVAAYFITIEVMG